MNFLLQHGLLAVLAALLLAPLGLPVPEEISLVTAGAIARMGGASYVAALVVGYVGVVGGDCITWTLGRRVGLHPHGWLGRLFGPHKLHRIARFYARFGSLTVVIFRNLPGMRFPAFFFSGATGMPLRTFVALDGLAALVTVGIWVRVGWWIGPRLRQVRPQLEHLRTGLLVLGLLVGAWIAWRILREVGHHEDAA